MTSSRKATASLIDRIEAETPELVRLIVERQRVLHPAFSSKEGGIGDAEYIRDVSTHLTYLADAIRANSLPLFANYIDWRKTLFNGLRNSPQEICEDLELTRQVLAECGTPAESAEVGRFIDLGIARLADSPQAQLSLLDEEHPLSDLAHSYFDALRQGRRADAARMIVDAVRNGASVRDIYLHVFQPSQREVGRLWQLNQMSVAQEHFCTAATQVIMSQLYPAIFGSARNGKRLVATGVGGELHEIGLRMVADFFEMEGWDTHYLGANLPTSSVAEAVSEQQPDVLAISATMVFHVKLVSDVIRQVRAIPREKPLGILVGGYPFNVDPQLWRHVGADGSAFDAAGAISAASRLWAA